MRTSSAVQWLSVLAVQLFLGAGVAAALSDVTTLGLKADGATDDTAALQAALDAGKTDLNFPRGVYLLGTVKIPAETTLRFAAGSRVRFNTSRIVRHAYVPGPGALKPVEVAALFILAGDRITIEGADFDFVIADGGQVNSTNVSVVIFASHQKDLRFTGLRAIRRPDTELLPLEKRGPGGRFASAGKGKPGRPSLIQLNECRNIVLENSQAENMRIMMDALGCSEITVKGNRAVSCLNISSFHEGSEWLRHIENWSRDVRHQCVWRGSNANDVRKLKPDDPRRGTADQVIRGPRSYSPDFKAGTLGAFDVLVQGNYAEYGRTLAWGNKGRQVIFQGNTGKFMQDYTFGTEGGENVVFANNISINSAVAGFACYYWSEKVVMTGNMALVRDEPWDSQWSWLPKEKYQGGLLRLHAIGHPEHKSGTGKAVISGNLFMSEFPDRPRRVGIEAGRDVLFSGNKIVNGVISAKNSGDRELSIIGNDITHRTPRQVTAIQLQPMIKSVTVKDNVIKRSPPPTQPPASVLLAMPTAPVSDEPAIAVACLGDKGAQTRVLEGNQIVGWSHAITARSMSKKGTDRFLLRNNSSDGAIGVEAVSGRAKYLAEGNINLLTLEPIKINQAAISTEQAKELENEEPPMPDDDAENDDIN